MATPDETLIVEARLIDAMTGPLNKIKGATRSAFGSMQQQAAKAQKGFSKFFNSAKKGIASFATRFGPAALVVGGLTLAMRGLGKAIDFVNEKSAEFEKTISKVKAILKPTSAELRALSDEAKLLGETTSFSASEAGSAFVELGKLGLNAAQILAASNDVLNLAAVAQSEMGVAAEATARTLGQFGLSAAEAGHVTDIMAKSFNISALDLNRFSESMKFVGATAGSLGINLQTATGALAEMASKGIVGSQAGTALRRIMLELGDSSSKAAKQIGFVVNSSESFQRALEVLQSKNLTPGQIKDTFGLLSSTAAGILIKGSTNVEEFTKQLNNAQGTAKEFADTMLDNVAGATKILESAQEGLGIAIGEAFGSSKRKRIEFYTRVVGRASEFIKAHKDELTALANFFSGAFIGALRFVLRGFEIFTGILETIQLSILKTASTFTRFFSIQDF